MPRSPARFTQADVARAVRAAKAEGWRAVRILLPSGASIEVAQEPERLEPKAPEPTTNPEPVAKDESPIIL